jgi:hypothetical protein
VYVTELPHCLVEEQFADRAHLPPRLEHIVIEIKVPSEEHYRPSIDKEGDPVP